MTKQRFVEILREYKIAQQQIEILWRTRPPEIELEEEVLRATAVKVFVPMTRLADRLAAEIVTEALKDLMKAREEAQAEEDGRKPS